MINTIIQSYNSNKINNGKIIGVISKGRKSKINVLVVEDNETKHINLFGVEDKPLLKHLEPYYDEFGISEVHFVGSAITFTWTKTIDDIDLLPYHISQENPDLELSSNLKDLSSYEYDTVNYYSVDDDPSSNEWKLVYKNQYSVFSEYGVKLLAPNIYTTPVIYGYEDVTISFRNILDEIVFQWALAWNGVMVAHEYLADDIVIVKIGEDLIEDGFCKYILALMLTIQTVNVKFLLKQEDNLLKLFKNSITITDLLIVAKKSMESQT